MSKRQKKERKAGGASWMDTYGDLVTLLLTFFVLLFASSSISEEKWIRIVESFTGAPPGSVLEPIDPNNPTAGLAQADMVQQRDKEPNEEEQEESAEQAQIRMRFDELYEQLNEYVEQQDLKMYVALDRDDRYIYITIIEGILFDSGYADIRDDIAEGILADIGAMLSAYIDSIQDITVEGHTDNVPVSERNPSFRDNLQLSTERAGTVVRFMEEAHNIPGNYFTASGKGEWYPIDTNDTEEGRQRNRRVQFNIESKFVDEIPDGATLSYGVREGELGSEP
ncbi:MAG: OmpA/MotB family protein [Christensenellaceae bacterium]|jgi:chemotaxis protein MotB